MQGIGGIEPKCCLQRPLARKDLHRCPDKNIDVEPHRPIADIIDIQIHPSVIAGGVAARNLPQSGQSRLDPFVGSKSRLVLLHLFPDNRARSHQAQIALEHVPELGEFVQARGPEPFAQGEDTRVMGEFVPCGPFLQCLGVTCQMVREDFFGMGDHGPEFPDGDVLAAHADALMPEKDRPGRGHEYGQSDNADNRHDQGKGHDDEGHVHDPFDRLSAGVEEFVLDLEAEDAADVQCRDPHGGEAEEIGNDDHAHKGRDIAFHDRQQAVPAGPGNGHNGHEPFAAGEQFFAVLDFPEYGYAGNRVSLQGGIIVKDPDHLEPETAADGQGGQDHLSGPARAKDDRRVAPPGFFRKQSAHKGAYERTGDQGARPAGQKDRSGIELRGFAHKQGDGQQDEHKGYGLADFLELQGGSEHDTRVESENRKAHGKQGQHGPQIRIQGKGELAIEQVADENGGCAHSCQGQDVPENESRAGQPGVGMWDDWLFLHDGSAEVGENGP